MLSSKRAEETRVLTSVRRHKEGISRSAISYSYVAVSYRSTSPSHPRSVKGLLFGLISWGLMMGSGGQG